MLKQSSNVIPAQAGIQWPFISVLDSGLRRNDGVEIFNYSFAFFAPLR